jgi:hypothetical protein
VSRRTRAFLVAVIVVGAALAGRLIDYPKLTGALKGDEATYVSMAFSVADDFDLGYDRRDFERFGQIYGAGRNGQVKPEGIFLKPGKRPASERLEYGKAFIYSVAAAPFAQLGGLGGMFVFNLLLLAGCVWCAVKFCAARVGGWRGHALAISFIVASSAPIWAVWLTPEIFNFALVFYAYFLWLYKVVNPSAATRSGFLGSAWSDVIAAALIGVATYSKISNAPLIAPLATYALWMHRRSLVAGIQRTALIVAAFVAVTGGLFGANALITGGANYQAGAPTGRFDQQGRPVLTRKTFYGNFPFDDAGSTYETAKGANEMVTDPNKISSDILFPGDPHFWEVLGHNVWYFFSGRDSGLVPYFFPGALILALWLVRWREATSWQVFTFLAAAGIAVILLVWTPYTWNGAGGPTGSRYFLSIYPVIFFLVPAGTGAAAALAAWIGGLACVGPILLQPFDSQHARWTIPERAPLRWLPVELTMMDDLPVRLNQSRGRLSFGEPRNALLYYMDAGTYNPEGQGFWVAGGVRTDIVVRVSEDATTSLMKLSAHSPIANDVTVTWGGSTCTMSLKPDIPAACEVRARSGAWAHGGNFFRLTVTTTAGFVPSDRNRASADSRNLGVFLEPVFEGQPIVTK